MGEAMLWIVRWRGRRSNLGPEVTRHMVDGRRMLVYLVAMLVLRYRRIRADELRHKRGRYAPLQTHGMDYDNDSGESGS